MGWQILLGLALLVAPAVQAQQKKQPASQKKSAAPAANAPPSEAASQAKVFPLETLRVEGAERIAPAKIIAASGLKIGQPITKADFEDARARLMATGAFESVGYQFDPSAA